VSGRGSAEQQYRVEKRDLVIVQAIGDAKILLNDQT
jgi:hypothetical protein